MSKINNFLTELKDLMIKHDIDEIRAKYECPELLHIDIVTGYKNLDVAYEFNTFGDYLDVKRIEEILEGEK